MSKVRGRSSSTARDEISAEAMKGILKRADVHLNGTLVNQLLISFDSTLSLVNHVNDMIGRKEAEEVQRVMDKYEMDKNELLAEISRREKYGLQ